MVIATQSRVLPVPTNTSSFPADDLAAQFDLATPFASQGFPDLSDWEHWGEEPIIDLCEVRLGFNGFSLRKLLSEIPSGTCSSSLPLDLSSTPLPPIFCQSSHLSKLMILPGGPRVDSSTDAASRAPMYLVVFQDDYGDCELPVCVTG